MAAPAAATVDAALMDAVRAAIEARYKQRWARAAELFERAASRFAASGAPADSLVTAGLRLRAALALAGQAQHSPADAVRLNTEAWAITAAASRVLIARADSATLLPPGGLRADELAYARAVELVYMSVEYPAGANDANFVSGLEADAPLHGYEAFLRAAQLTLGRLLSDDLPPLPAAEAAGARALVLRALALIRDVSHPFRETLGVEARLAQLLGQVCAPGWASRNRGSGADAAFYDQLVQSWNWAETQAALLAHRALVQDDGEDMLARDLREAAERRAADTQARGLRRCALPSCAAKEVSVRQFKVCGACKLVAYCCADHAKAHWRSGHKQACNAQNNA
jgi:hypothetical protein